MLKLSVYALIPKVLFCTVVADLVFKDSDLYMSFFAILNTPIYWMMILVATVANIVPFYFMRNWYNLVTCP
jgi:hypothetical protein